MIEDISEFIKNSLFKGSLLTYLRNSASSFKVLLKLNIGNILYKFRLQRIIKLTFEDQSFSKWFGNLFELIPHIED